MSLKQDSVESCKRVYNLLRKHILVRTSVQNSDLSMIVNTYVLCMYIKSLAVEIAC